MTGADPPYPLACPICRHCRCDIAGLVVTDACPRCDRPIWQTRTRRATRPVCHRCGYHLAGLRVTDACPECGSPIWQTYERLHATTSTEAQPPMLAVASLAIAITGGLVVLLAYPGPWLLSGTAFGLPGLIVGIVALPKVDDKDDHPLCFTCALLGITFNIALAAFGLLGAWIVAFA
jgi:hypothetical protein